MSQDFSGLKDVAAIAAKAVQLREASDVKESISEEKNEINKQRELENRFPTWKLLLSTGHWIPCVEKRYTWNW